MRPLMNWLRRGGVWLLRFILIEWVRARVRAWLR